MVDEFPRQLGRKGVVVSWRELMRVPGQIYIQRRNGHLVGMFLHDCDEAVVFGDEAAHGGPCGRAVKPIELDHLVDEDALAHDGATQVEGKGREVFPVAAHHLAGGHFGLAREVGASCAAGAAVETADHLAVFGCLFDQLSHVYHGRVLGLGVDEFEDFGAEFELD